MDPTYIAKFIAVPSGFLLGSYNFVFSQNVIPHVYNVPASISTPIFTKIYYLGATTIAPIAATTILSYGFLSYNSASTTKRTIYASSAILTLSTLILTTTAMKPGIDRLIEISKDSRLLEKTGVDKEVTGLLKTWVAQNYFRASLHLTAGLLGFYAILS